MSVSGGENQDLLFPAEFNRTFECPVCKRIIHGDELVKWVDEDKGIFKCPGCKNKVAID